MESEKQTPLEYKQKGKYLNILMPAKDVKVTRVQYIKKPVLEIQNPKYPSSAEASILIVGNDKVGMLADYLGINRNQLRSQMKRDAAGTLKWLNEELTNAGERKMKLDASEFEGKFFAFTIATEIHTTVTFTQIRAVVNEVLGTSVGETNCEGGRGIKWYKQCAVEELSFDTLAAEIVILSGGNTLKDSIKVITRIQVGSCKNSLICGDFSRVKHTENWRQRLTTILKTANEIAKTAIHVVKMGAEHPMSLEEGLQYIENIELPVTDPQKVARVKDALKTRFAMEYKKGTRWELSQALSFYGTHGNPEDSSEHTLEVITGTAYQMLRGH